MPGKAPEWDSLQKEADGRLLLEEAKSGTVDADDRWTLWRRVRRTGDFLAREGDASEVAVRLTVNAASLPDNPEH
ncbi:MAG: hypothetical protein KA745_14915, partial [Gemmatimonadales bacterium]|nr:hypothetical protein [Gemmatimonadales bacterium]